MTNACGWKEQSKATYLSSMVWNLTHARARCSDYRTGSSPIGPAFVSGASNVTNDILLLPSDMNEHCLILPIAIIYLKQPTCAVGSHIVSTSAMRHVCLTEQLCSGKAEGRPFVWGPV